MVFKVESSKNYIKDEEYGDLYLYSDNPHTYLEIKDISCFRLLCEILNDHNCYISCLRYDPKTWTFTLKLKGE